MDKIKSPGILVLYAKAKEGEGLYTEAEKAYEMAQSWENVVKINMKQLDNFNKAKLVLREKCPTSTIAFMVAKECESKQNWVDAIEFYILAGKKEEAFEIAKGKS